MASASPVTEVGAAELHVCRAFLDAFRLDFCKAFHQLAGGTEVGGGAFFGSRMGWNSGESEHREKKRDNAVSHDESSLLGAMGGVAVLEYPRREYLGQGYAICSHDISRYPSPFAE